jgi:hypothetical protein
MIRKKHQLFDIYSYLIRSENHVNSLVQTLIHKLSCGKSLIHCIYYILHVNCSQEANRKTSEFTTATPALW